MCFPALVIFSLPYRMTNEPTVPANWNSTMGPLPSKNELKVKKVRKDTYLYKRAETCVEVLSMKMKAAEDKFLQLKIVHDATIKSYKERIEAARVVMQGGKAEEPVVAKKPIAIVQKSEEEIVKENKVELHNNLSSIFFGGGEEEGEEIEEATEEEIQQAKARQQATRYKPVECTLTLDEEAEYQASYVRREKKYQEDLSKQIAADKAARTRSEEAVCDELPTVLPYGLPLPDSAIKYKQVLEGGKRLPKQVGPRVSIYPNPQLDG